jgi:hypothetical protein
MSVGGLIRAIKGADELVDGLKATVKAPPALPKPEVVEEVISESELARLFQKSKPLGETEADDAYAEGVAQGHSALATLFDEGAAKIKENAGKIEDQLTAFGTDDFLVTTTISDNFTTTEMGDHLISKITLPEFVNNQVGISSIDLDEVALQFKSGLISQNEAVELLEAGIKKDLDEADEIEITALPEDPEEWRDDLHIDLTNQDAVDSFENFVDNDFASVPEIIEDVKRIPKQEGDASALAVIGQVRGTGIYSPKSIARRLKKNYDPESLLSSQYPPLNTALNLDPMDHIAINFYTKNGDEIMNEALRNPDKLLEGSGVDNAIKATQRALDELPPWTPEDGFLYRRVNDRKVARLYEEMEIGQEYTEMAFKSTTREPIDLEKQDQLTRLTIITVPKSTGSNARGIEGLSEYPGSEQEVMFKHGTSFRVVDKEVLDVTIDMFGGKKGTERKVIVFVEEI